MMRIEKQAHPARQRPLWLALLIVHLAWPFQLLANYLLVSLACRLEPFELEILGMSGFLFLMYLVTSVALIMVLIAGAVVYREWRALRRDEGFNSIDPDDPYAFLARVGLLLSGLYVVVIVLVGTTHVFLEPSTNPGCASWSPFGSF